MTRLTWGDPGTKFFETGIDQGVLYVDSAGYAWNGLTAVTESPTGGESKPFYADGIKYLNLSSAEEFEATIEAFGAPDAFGPCDGRVAVYNGLYVGQQPRKAFSMAYRTLVGNDTLSKNYGYKIHLIWNALAAPTERAYTTNNDSPEGVGMSWSITTLPPSLTGYKPTAYMEIDSRFTPKGLLKAIEDILFGSASADARMPFQSELAQMFKSEGPIMRRNYVQNPGFRTTAGQTELYRNRTLNPSLKNDASDWSGYAGNQPPYSLANTYTYARQAPPVALTVPTLGGGTFSPAFCIVEQGGTSATFAHTDVTVNKSGAPCTPGGQVSAGVWVLTNRPMLLNLRFRFSDAQAGAAGDYTSANVTTTAGVWQRLTGTVTVPAGAVSYIVTVRGADSTAAMSATDYMAVACPVVINSSYLPDYFDGDLAAKGSYTFVWAGNGVKYVNNSVVLAWTEIRRNLLTNPGIKGAGTTLTEMRRNKATDPEALSGTNAVAGGFGWYPRWYGTGGAGTTSYVTNASDGPLGIKTYSRKTWTTAPTGNNSATGFQHSYSGSGAESVVVPNAWYAWAGYLRTSSGGKYTRCSVEWRDSTHTKIGNEVATAVSSTPLTPNVWTRVSGAFQAPSNAAYGIFTTDIYTPVGNNPPETVWAVGDTLDGTALIVEQDCMSVGPYFSGRTTAAGGLQYAWVGTVDASQSIARGYQAYEMYGPALNYVDDQGRMVLMASRTSLTNDTYVAPGGDTGGMRLGMQAGKTYTFSVEGFATAADASEQSYARRLNIWIKDGTGTYRTVGNSSQVPVGTPTRVSVTGYIPSDATEAFVRFYNGSTGRVRDVVWSKALLEEADTAMPYFDGSTPSADGLSYMWIGSVDRSVSIAYGKSPANYNVTQNVVAWQGADGASIRILQKKGVSGFVEVSGSLSTPVVQDDVVTVSVDASADSAASATITTALTGTQQNTTSPTYNLTTTPQRMSVTSQPIPAGATFCRMLFFPAAVGIIYTLKNNMAEKIAQALPYFDGFTPPAGGYFYHWEGTADSSTSVVNTWN